MDPIDKYYGNNSNGGGFGSGLINQPFGGHDKSYNTQPFQSDTKGLDFNNTNTGNGNGGSGSGNGGSGNSNGGSNMGINAGVGALNALSSLSDTYNTGGQPHYTSQGLINNDKKWYQTGAAKGALKGATTGASMGSSAGIIGTAVGAVVGGVAGALVGNSKDKEENKEVRNENRRISTENLFNEMSNTRQKNDETNYNKQHSDAKLNNVFNSLNSINTDTNTSNRKYTIENGTMYNISENGLLPVTY